MELEEAQDPVEKDTPEAAEAPVSGADGDASTLRVSTHPKFGEWIQFDANLAEKAHWFNSKPRSLKAVGDYLLRQFDLTCRMQLELVDDYSSARQCDKAIDDILERFLDWFRRWQTRSKPRKLSTRAEHAVRKRLLRRGAHWKAKAYAIGVGVTAETREQRAARRKRILNPLLKKAGIDSDEAWADRAGDSIDRNTPRDYEMAKR
jgi:hypothetical protein